jgi:carbon-monoxide dehydrogenase large subunit
MKFGAGQSVRRLEDNRLITGHGEYTDDFHFPGTAHAAVLRSPHAHAKLGTIDSLAAREAPGVLAVYTHKDIEAAGLGTVPCMALLPNKDGSPIFNPPRHALAKDRVRHLGDPVAMVIAETAAQARDAAELIQVDYEELPVVGDTEGALKAAPLHQGATSNVALDHDLGDKAAVDKAFAAAAHTTKIRINNQRIVVNAMEPRAAVGQFDKATGKYTLHTGSQGVHGMRAIIAKQILKVEEKNLRVVTKEVGGGFGMKSFVYPEYPLVLFAAKQLGRPVKWTADRAESFLTDTQGRDNITYASLALDKDHKVTAVRAETIANLGAYLSQFAPFIPTMAAGGMQVGVYAIPAVHQATKCVFTNTVPVDAYRGAGRPEAAYVIERLMDQAAHELKISPLELRLKNFIRPDQMPFKFPVAGTIDSGTFAKNLEDATKEADWAGFEARRKTARSKGRVAGIGVSYYVERTAAGFEMAHVEVRSGGEVHVIAGTQSNGQGHETAYAQLVAERLGVPIDIIKVTSGDSDAIRAGGGTGGSRSIMMAGGAIGVAVTDIIEKGKALAANELEAATGDIEYNEGKFRIAGTDRTLGLFDVARIAKTQANVVGAEGIAADGEFRHQANTWPNGCHICEVEIDPETGESEITRYTIVDDFGVIVNPMLVEGQVHGGVVQGLGQAMGEIAEYDPQSGQLITGSFMDYWMPRADNMPKMTFKTNEVRCTTNPLGVKGCGEAGTVGAAPAFVNAVVDALRPYGVTHIDMPVTPLKVWQITKGRAAA